MDVQFSGNPWFHMIFTWPPLTQHYFPSFGQVLLQRIATKPTLEWRLLSIPRSKINVLLIWLESMWILKCLHLSCTTISWALQITGTSFHVCFDGKPLKITIYHVCFDESILPEIWKIGGCGFQNSEKLSSVNSCIVVTSHGSLRVKFYKFLCNKSAWCYKRHKTYKTQKQI